MLYVWGLGFLFRKEVYTFSGVEAHMTMASDIMPLILDGFRLHRRMAGRFCISSRGMNLRHRELRHQGRSCFRAKWSPLLDESGYDGPRLLFAHIHLLHVERVRVGVPLGGADEAHAHV